MKKQANFNENIEENKSKICIICKKEIIDSRWKLTNYCSLKCFSATIKEEKEFSPTDDMKKIQNFEKKEFNF